MMEKKDWLGHRKRLREKFLKSGLEGFHDYEIVELLLSLGRTQSDCKPQAKEALRRFKTLRGVLEAPAEELQDIKGIGPHSVFGIKFMQAVAREFLKEKSLEKPVCSSSQEIYDYFFHSMRDLKKEIIKIVYLNSQNQILEIQDFAQGTVDSNHMYPREVMESALKCHAVGMVIVHNHPSGNPKPSNSDFTLTRTIILAGYAMQIKVLDHIIIGDNCFYSFAGQGLIEKYETEISSLKIA
ncbi:MAG TPA: DNA repair protein RadC [Dehalococcoidales bacterium]|nr:DNA repair protein RadC [Dehalococcoidales bacterium]